jgi:SacI restriction endonuclease
LPNAIHQNRIDAVALLKEILRYLLIIKAENEGRMKQLIADLKQTGDGLPLSSEQIVTLLHQNLSCKNSSRLPVLIVAAAYSAVEVLIGESTRPLFAHNAADKQTGSVGDIEITLKNNEKAVSCYEMKDKRVTTNDINHALKKALNLEDKIDNYIFITTDVIEIEVVEYAKSLYESTGIEIAILDCLGFARHFLHFFHRYRISFLDNYQDLVMREPNSSVGQPLKEAFLILRKQAESN